MPQVPKHFYEFRSFRLDAVRRVLFMEKEPLPLPPKVLDTLLVLVQRRGQVVEKDELMKLLWPDSFVEEANLSQNVSMLRKVLGESPNDHHYIVTVPGRGYRFVAEVTELGHDEETDLIIAERTRSRIVITQDGKASPPSEEEKVLLAAQEKLSIPGESFVEVGGSSRRRAPWLSPKAIVLATLLITVLGVGLLSIWLFRGRPSTHQLEIKSIAVLPLENHSGDPSQDYFADGMTEVLITDLGKISALRVISRTSVMHFKGTAKTVPEIARELNVDAVVEGAVMRSGDRVRITAQLIQAATDKHLWAETYERDLRDVLRLQGEVARTIADEIKAKVTPSEQALLTAERVVNPKAHEAYSQGRRSLETLTAEGVRTALKYFERAIELDPTYAAAYCGLADAYSAQSTMGYVPIKEAYARAKESAMKALALNENLAEAYASLCNIRVRFDWDWQAAERDCTRAVELNPNSATALQYASSYFIAMGRIEEGLALKRRYVEVDPLSPAAHISRGWGFYFSRQYDEAIAETQSALGLDPNLPMAWTLQGHTYLEKKMYPESINAYNKFEAAGNRVDLADLGHAYAKAGQRNRAFKMLDELKQRSRSEVVHPGAFAWIYLGLGDKDQTFHWLEKAFEERDPNWFSNAMVSPSLDPLRSDPRFQDLLRRMNFPP